MSVHAIPQQHWINMTSPDFPIPRVFGEIFLPYPIDIDTIVIIIEIIVIQKY